MRKHKILNLRRQRQKYETLIAKQQFLSFRCIRPNTERFIRLVEFSVKTSHLFQENDTSVSWNSKMKADCKNKTPSSQNENGVPWAPHRQAKHI